MSSTHKGGEKSSLLFLFVVLSGLLLILKTIKLWPMIILSLLLSFSLSGVFFESYSKGRRFFKFFTNLLVPLSISFIVFGLPFKSPIYRGIFEYSWGNQVFSWMATHFNLLVEKSCSIKWIKDLIKLQSFSALDIEIYLARVFQTGLIFSLGFLAIGLTNKSEGFKEFSKVFSQKSYQIFEPLVQMSFLRFLEKDLSIQSKTMLGVSGSLLFLGLMGFYFSFNPKGILALSLPFFFLPVFGRILFLFFPQLAQIIFENANGVQNKIDRVLIGHELHNPKEKVYLTKANLNYHVQLIGGSGAGKTTLIQVILSQLIEQKMGVIFIDLKADFETINWIKEEASKSGRKNDLEFFCLTQHQISKTYNPIKHGTPQEILSQIMNSLDWSEEYYKKTSSTALSDILLALCQIRDRGNLEFTLEDIARILSSPEEMETLAVSEFLDQESKETLRKRAEILQEKEGIKQISGLLSDLLNISRSSAGPLIGRKSLDPSSIDIKETIKRGKITYFLLNSMADKASCTQLGKLVLQDLIRSVGEIYDEVPENERKPCLLIVDEFASFATDNFIDLLNRARGARLGILVAHQSRGDLKRVSPTFCDQLERNCNTKLIFGTDSPDDAEYFASQAGTRKTQKSTARHSRMLFWEHDTGERSVRETEEFVVHPNQIRQLGQGQILKISRLVDIGCILTKVRNENEEQTFSEKEKGLLGYFSHQQS
ncbi:MAG: TraM recognition domain-containing protein [Bdellovibrionales bacterium]|nr:TraM recognition domain-containing protein [Bdellovibrionales bacterium]